MKIRYADFPTQEAYAEALAKAAMPIVAERSEAREASEDLDEDDDDLLQAVARLLE